MDFKKTKSCDEDLGVENFCDTCLCCLSSAISVFATGASSL